MTSVLDSKIFLFFDTNALESRFAKDCFFLSNPEFSKIFYWTEQFIKDNKLEQSIKICIPEISLLEIKKHLVNCFHSNNDILDLTIEKYKKTFGSLFEISIDKKSYNSIQNYKKYIDEYYINFIEERKSYLEIIPFPKDERTFTSLINKALYSIKPFTKANKQGKEYSDAGFKDAVICETIIQYTNEQIGIFYTKDNDFKDLFSELDNIKNIIICDDENNLKELLLSKTNILNNKYKINKILSSDEYFIKTLLVKVNFTEEANYKFDEITKTKEVEEGTEIDFSATINGVKYKFKIIYELNANELIEVLAFGEYNEK